MPNIHVTCAIIERDGLVLAARRSGSMQRPLKWEFPGGKIRPGEDPEACLRRELMEELDIAVSIRHCLSAVVHDYTDIRVTLHPFVCSIASGEPRPSEHAAITWLPIEKLGGLDWAAADLPVLDAYCRWKGRGDL